MIKLSNRKLKILDFDIENRPLTYLGGDWTTAEVTAVAAGWIDKPKVHCWLLGVDEPFDMLMNFWRMYDEADCVTGHYIRKHDLPILNGAFLEYGLPTLTKKLTSDTKMDLIKRKDLSASQESLSGMYGLKMPKEHMSQTDWRKANRLSEDGIKETQRRVVGDVRQHKALRQRLIDMNALKAPKMWSP